MLKWRLFAIICLLQRCLQNCGRENQEYHIKFPLPLLQSAKSGWNNVEKLEIVFKRAWIIAVVPLNWITSSNLFSEVLELYFHQLLISCLGTCIGGQKCMNFMLNCI